MRLIQLHCMKKYVNNIEWQGSYVFLMLCPDNKRTFICFSNYKSCYAVNLFFIFIKKLGLMLVGSKFILGPVPPII